MKDIPSWDLAVCSPTRGEKQVQDNRAVARVIEVLQVQLVWISKPDRWLGCKQGLSYAKTKESKNALCCKQEPNYAKYKN